MGLASPPDNLKRPSRRGRSGTSPSDVLWNRPDQDGCQNWFGIGTWVPNHQTGVQDAL